MRKKRVELREGILFYFVWREEGKDEDEGKVGDVFFGGSYYVFCEVESGMVCLDWGGVGCGIRNLRYME